MAYIDYINDKFASLEEAYKSKFVQNSKGQWVLKKYSIDSYRHLLTAPNDIKSIGAVPLKPWFVILYSRNMEYEGYEVRLEFSVEVEVSVIESVWFNAGRNGGGKEINLSDDYFRKNSIDEFIKFLYENLINKDWIYANSQHIKNDPYIKKLFNIPEQSDDGSVIDNISPLR